MLNTGRARVCLERQNGIFDLNSILRMIFFVCCCGIVVDTWLRDQKVPGSSPGCARSTLSPWERLFTCISSSHLCVKRVPDYRQYRKVTRYLYWQLLCNAPQGVEKGTVVGMACRGPHVKRLKHFSWISAI